MHPASWFWDTCSAFNMAQIVTHEVLQEVDDEVVFKLPIGRRRTSRRPHTMKQPEIAVYDEELQCKAATQTDTFMSPLQQRGENIAPVSASNKPSVRRQVRCFA